MANQPTQQATVKATIKELKIKHNIIEEAESTGGKYFVRLAPSDTFSACEKNYYLGVDNHENVVTFDLKDEYEIPKDMFDFLSAHQNDIFKFEIENVTSASDTSNTILAITSATLIC